MKTPLPQFLLSLNFLPNAFPSLYQNDKISDILWFSYILQAVLFPSLKNCQPKYAYLYTKLYPFNMKTIKIECFGYLHNLEDEKVVLHTIAAAICGAFAVCLALCSSFFVEYLIQFSYKSVKYILYFLYFTVKETETQ